MPSPTRDARLRIKKYTPIAEGAPFSTVTKDLVFKLDCNRIQKTIMDGADVKTYYGRKNIVLGFSMIEMVITLNGTIGIEFKSGQHSTHALGNPADGVEHIPDWIDLEEAGVLWGHRALPGNNPRKADPDWVPQLEIEHGLAGAFRVYKGLIREMSLTRYAGHAAADFQLVFDVVYSIDEPGLRQWTTS